MTDHWQHTPKEPCPKKHTWVYYHSYRFRECLDCEKRESLWADFGLAQHPEKRNDQ